MKQITAIDQAACSWISLISGINLNVFKGFATENDLVNYFLRRAYHDNFTVIASVVFSNVNINDTKLPPHTIYKIRQNASLTPSTKRLRDRFWVPSPAQNGFVYYDFAFSWIQEMIDRAIIDTASRPTGGRARSLLPGNGLSLLHLRQLSPDDPTRPAALFDDLLGLRLRHADAKHRLRERSSTERSDEKSWA